MSQPIQLDRESIQEIQENDKHDITRIQIDGMVLLRLINHCSDKVPNAVNGILLGLNKKETLEVTNCFPMISKKTDNVDGSEPEVNEERRYQVEMLRCLRDINTDCNTVGWYQSTFLESFMNAKTIDAQYQYQLEFGKKCVHIVFDPIRTRKGHLYVKAYRLSDKFFDLVRESVSEQQSLDTLRKKYSAKAKESTFADVSTAKKQDKDSLPASIQRVQIIQDVLTKLNMTSEDIFEEVPLIIHNITLVEAFLYEISKTYADNEFDNLNLSSSTFLEKSLEGLLECSDDLTNERNRYQFYQRKLAQQKQNLAKKKEKSVEEQEFLLKNVQQPSQLESLMISYQINNTCKQINKVASEQISKLYLTNGLFRRENGEQ